MNTLIALATTLISTVKADASEILAGADLPSEKLLLAVLLVNAIQIIWSLINRIIESKAKREDKTEEKIDELLNEIRKLEKAFERLDAEMPSEEKMLERLKPQIELIVLKSLRDLEH